MIPTLYLTGAGGFAYLLIMMNMDADPAERISALGILWCAWIWPFFVVAFIYAFVKDSLS